MAERDYTSMTEFEQLQDPGPLGAALRAMDEATGGVVAARFPPAFREQLKGVAEAVSSPSDEVTTKRMLVLCSVLTEIGGILDTMLPKGRHKSLAMTALEEVMVRMFLSLRCDDPNDG